MKKFIIIILLLIAGTAQAQFFPTPLPSWLKNIRSSENTWTLPQTFQNGAVFQGKTYIDSLILRVYLLDTGTSIVRTILPQTTRLYNLGGSSNYWLNSYTQNLYVDTIKSSVRIDTLYFGAETIYKGSSVINFSNSIQFPSGLATKCIDWGAGNTSIRNGSSYNFYITQYDGSTSDTTLYITGADSSVKIFGNLMPSLTYKQNLGSESYYWNYGYINNITLSALIPRTSAGITIGGGVNPINFNGNVKVQSLNIQTDSTGAKADSVYIARHTLLVNCTNADSNVVWLSDYNVTGGQRYTIMKIDANAINVIVKSKSGYPINGAISKILNTQWQTATLAYRNKTWYIVNN